MDNANNSHRSGSGMPKDDRRYHANRQRSLTTPTREIGHHSNQNNVGTFNSPQEVTNVAFQQGYVAGFQAGARQNMYTSPIATSQPPLATPAPQGTNGGNLSSQNPVEPPPTITRVTQARQTSAGMTNISTPPFFSTPRQGKDNPSDPYHPLHNSTNVKHNEAIATALYQQPLQGSQNYPYTRGQSSQNHQTLGGTMQQESHETSNEFSPHDLDDMFRGPLIGAPSEFPTHASRSTSAAGSYADVDGSSGQMYASASASVAPSRFPSNFYQSTVLERSVGEFDGSFEAMYVWTAQAAKAAAKAHKKANKEPDWRPLVEICKDCVKHDPYCVSTRTEFWQFCVRVTKQDQLHHQYNEKMTGTKEETILRKVEILRQFRRFGNDYPDRQFQKRANKVCRCMDRCPDAIEKILASPKPLTQYYCRECNAGRGRGQHASPLIAHSRGPYR